MSKIRWGVVGTALINDKVVPPMQNGQYCRVDAIASRSLERAQAAADKFGIARAYESYAALLADPNIDAVYNSLPNHHHVAMSGVAMESGKHVLCEKPIARSAEEAEALIAIRDRTGKRIQEAFMVRTHPQWLRVRDLVRGGRIGELRAIQGFFSYYNTDPDNIRNQADIGGGGMLDIGCYPITTSRLITDAEPTRVIGLIDRDPSLGIDRLGSAILDYPGCQASFVYSTQLVPYQRMHFLGTQGRIEVEIPFNAPNDGPCRLLVDDGADLRGGTIETIEIPTCDQYGVAADAFSKSILDDTPQPVPLENSLANMRVIDALFRSAESGNWESP